jgi:hypothetical protein
VLYLLGFPVHGIGFLFNADHGHVSQALNPTRHNFLRLH